MKIKKRTLIFILLLFCLLTKSFGQCAVKDTGRTAKIFWGSLGLGSSSLGSISGLGTINADLTDHFFITVSGTGETDALVYSTINETTVNALVGVSFKSRHVLFSFSAGPGSVATTIYKSTYGSFTYEGDQATSNTVGLQLLAQAYAVLLSGLGIGVGAYANLNSARTTTGITVSIAFGHLNI